jgi:hypothetical protein
VRRTFLAILLGAVPRGRGPAGARKERPQPLIVVSNGVLLVTHAPA